MMQKQKNIEIRCVQAKNPPLRLEWRADAGTAVDGLFISRCSSYTSAPMITPTATLSVFAVSLLSNQAAKPPIITFLRLSA